RARSSHYGRRLRARRSRRQGTREGARGRHGTERLAEPFLVASLLRLRWRLGGVAVRPLALTVPLPDGLPGRSGGRGCELLVYGTVVCSGAGIPVGSAGCRLGRRLWRGVGQRARP